MSGSVSAVGSDLISSDSRSSTSSGSELFCSTEEISSDFLEVSPKSVTVRVGMAEYDWLSVSASVFRAVSSREISGSALIILVTFPGDENYFIID